MTTGLMPTTGQIQITPGRRLGIRMEIDSPHVVSLRAQFKAPNGPWIDFARGTDRDPVRLSTHEFVLPVLPRGSRVRMQFLFAGNPNRVYRVRLTFFQSDQPIAPPIRIQGRTNAAGAAGERVEVELV